MNRPAIIPGQISVVIPALSYDRYLQEALESVHNDGIQNLEIIVVLDGVSNKPLPEWANHVNIVNLSTGSRVGAAGAINLGLQHARGEFIARLDADDITLPGRFAEQLAVLRTNDNLVLVGTAAQLVDENGYVIGDFYVRPYEDLRKQLLTTNPFVHSSLLIRQSAMRDVGGYDERCIRMQDYDLVLRLAMTGELALIDVPYVRYRVHAEQSSKKLSGFFGLMRHISRQRRRLAASLGSPLFVQIANDLAFSLAQLLRYAGLRRPRYLKGAQTEFSRLK